MRSLHLGHSIGANSPRKKTMTLNRRRDEIYLNRLFRFCVKRWQTVESRRFAPFHGTAFEEFIHRSNQRLWAHRWFTAVQYVERLRAHACMADASIDVEARPPLCRNSAENYADPVDRRANGTSPRTISRHRHGGKKLETL
jgi:hypothetical protein